eukprot:139184-Alexandrium_andersonii.AAC.1
MRPLPLQTGSDTQCTCPSNPARRQTGGPGGWSHPGEERPDQATCCLMGGAVSYTHLTLPTICSV